MSKWPMVRLGDVCDIERGGSPRPIDDYITQEDCGVNWIKIGDTSPDSKYITNTKERIIPEGMRKSRYVRPGDFLLSNSMSFGRPYILKIDGCIHDGWLVLRDKREHFEKEFLYYALSSRATYNQFKLLAVGGVVNNLNSNIVKQVVFPLPPLEVQKKIAQTLDTAAELIALRKKQLTELDNLVKSVFFDMFGDPMKDEKGWAKRPAGELIDILAGYAFSSNNYTADKTQVKLCGGLIIMPDKIYWNEAKYWPADKIKGLERYQLEANDIVMALDRPWISSGFKIGLIKTDDLPTLLIQRTARIRGKNINQMFLYFLFKDRAFKIHAKTTETTVPHISTKDIITYKIPVPPLPLQNQFAEIVTKIEEQKALVHKAIDESQYLFDSLMDEYFE